MDGDVTQQLDLASLYRLRQADLLPAARFLEAAKLLRDDAFWTRWGRHALLGLGLAHILAGILCFFAFNWAAMPPFTKFAVIAAGIVLCALSSWFVGIHRPAGKSLLIGASVLTGVLLAVIGQVYQTGADAFQLFAAWGLVILPWVLISRSATHWAVWSVTVYLAVHLYLHQVWLVLEVIGPWFLALLAGLVPSALLVLREQAVRDGLDWLAPDWTRQVLLCLAAGHFALAGSGVIVTRSDWPILLVSILLLASATVIYRRNLPSFTAYAIAVSSFGCLGVAVGWMICAELLDPTSDLVGMAVFCAAMFGWTMLVVATIWNVLDASRPEPKETGS